MIAKGRAQTKEAVVGMIFKNGRKNDAFFERGSGGDRVKREFFMK